MEKHTYGTGLIGNCSYIAHIEKNTNISWLCMPRFDSDFLFGSMLDKKRGGEFTILPPHENYTSRQEYQENSNVLDTYIETSEGEAYKVTDFAPRFFNYDRYYKPSMLIRKIEPLKGEPKIKINCFPVSDHGKYKLKAIPESNHIQFSGRDQEVRLTTNCSITQILEKLGQIY